MKYAILDINGLPTAFYSDDIHDNIPTEAINITDEQWQECINNQGNRQFVNGIIVDYVEPITLEKVQATKLSEVLETYNAYNQSNIEYMGTTFQADYSSQDMLSKVIAIGSVPSNFYWLDYTNTKIPMSYTQLQGLAVLLLERNQVNFDNLQTQKVAINTATTVQQVQSL
jgi:hypothetical protein